MTKTGRPPTLRGQIERALEDGDDGCAEIACALRELAHLKRRLERAYLHGARGYRRMVIVSDALGPWDGVERRANWNPKQVAA